MESILKNVQRDICGDYLNSHDPSVGLYRVSKIDEDVVKELELDETIKVITYTDTTALLDCGIAKIEIFQDKDSWWNARIAE